jgi:hypothetical protein
MLLRIDEFVATTSAASADICFQTQHAIAL